MGKLEKAQEVKDKRKQLTAEVGFVECACVEASRSLALAELRRRFPYVDWVKTGHKVGGADPKCKVCKGVGARHPLLYDKNLKKLGVSA